MKKLLVLSLIGILLLPLEATVEAAPVTKKALNEVKATTVYKRKRARGYRKKKGFMWGLFRKKNPCGCPNH